MSEKTQHHSHVVYEMLEGASPSLAESVDDEYDGIGNGYSVPMYGRRSRTGCSFLFLRKIFGNTYTWISLVAVSVLLLASLRFSSNAPNRLFSDEAIREGKSHNFLYANRGYPSDYHRVKVLIPATKSDLRFCTTLFTSLVNGYPAPNLINFNASVDSFFVGQEIKIKGFKDFLTTSVQDDDIAILIDGYDVAFQLSLDVFMSRLGARGYQTHFSADKACWPPIEGAKFCTNIPESPLSGEMYGSLKYASNCNGPLFNPPRYLNSGASVGDGKTMRGVLRSALQIADEGTVGKNDQGVIAEAFQRKLYNVTLDYESVFFQTLVHSYIDVTWIVNPDSNTPPTWMLSREASSMWKLDLSDLGLDTAKGRETSVWKDRTLARNHMSNTIPVLLHHNLRKEMIANWLTYMWLGDPVLGPKLQTMLYEQSSTPGAAGAWDGDRWLGFDELCGAYDLFAPPSSSPS